MNEIFYLYVFQHPFMPRWAEKFGMTEKRLAESFTKDGPTVDEEELLLHWYNTGERSVLYDIAMSLAFVKYE